MALTKIRNAIPNISMKAAQLREELLETQSDETASLEIGKQVGPGTVWHTADSRPPTRLK
jgi:hypothetical protein